jgi:hypothetical protein
MKQCKHPTCGQTCRRPKKTVIRTLLKRSQKPINPYSKKRQSINREYSALRKQFLKEGDLCELNTPDCTGLATCIHHVRGRTLHFLNTDTWKRSCTPCNNWVEANHKQAADMGLKKSKFK